MHTTIIQKEILTQTCKTKNLNKKIHDTVYTPV